MSAQSKFDDNVDEFITCIIDCSLEGAELDDYVHGFMVEVFGAPEPADADRMVGALLALHDGLSAEGRLTIGEYYDDAINALRRWQS